MTSTCPGSGRRSGWARTRSTPSWTWRLPAPASTGRAKILFEPHVFWRNLPKSKRAQAQAAGLAYPKWRPGTYGKESTQYPKLFRAMEIDEDAALKACSWGLGQILGENHKMAGFDTVGDFVLAMMADEENHVEAMINFLIASGLDDDLREHDWTAVARGYNGPGYRQHNYHGRMKKAYEKWASIRDTPYDREKDGGPPVPKAAPQRGGRRTVRMTKGQLTDLQLQLYRKGYTEVGTADGAWGNKTRAAIALWDADNGGQAPQAITPAFTAMVKAAPARAIPRSRAEITPGELAKRGSKTIPLGRAGTAIATGGSIVAGTGAVVDAVAERVETVSDTVQTATRSLNPFVWFWELVPLWAWLLLAAIAFAGLAYLFYQLIWLRVMQERENRTVTNPVRMDELSERQPDDNRPVVDPDDPEGRSDDQG